MRPLAFLYMDESPLFDRVRRVLRECGVVGMGSSHEGEAVDWITRPGVDVVIRAGARASSALEKAARASGVDLVSLHADDMGTDATHRDLSSGDQGRLEALLAGLPEAARQRREEDHLDGLIGRSDPILDLVEQLLRMAPSHAPILITGESGTGKGLAAAAIHDRSRNAGGPFVAVNCGAIPPSLIESHLFGHEKGSFTGAERRHAGCFEQAAHGTLFLDEIAELPLGAQVKLLRVLESGEVTRVGGERPIPLHCRVVTATNRSPEGAVKSGQLREDLFYRLGVLRLNLPSLRDRKGDIPELALHFARLLSGQEGLARRLSRGALDRLSAYPWPGNVRELRNTLHSAVILAPGPVIGEEDLPLDASPRDLHEEHLRIPVGIPVEEAERRLILRTLSHLGGNKSRAAKVLGISLKTLYNRLHAYGEMLPRGEDDRETA
jgi:two-component system, NtrC family, response regulator AtoC